jgi:hypothetical protein
VKVKICFKCCVRVHISRLQAECWVPWESTENIFKPYYNIPTYTCILHTILEIFVFKLAKCIKYWKNYSHFQIWSKRAAMAACIVTWPMNSKQYISQGHLCVNLFEFLRKTNKNCTCHETREFCTHFEANVQWFGENLTTLLHFLWNKLKNQNQDRYVIILNSIEKLTYNVLNMITYVIPSK